MGVIYRNYNSPNRKTELLKIAKECKKRRFKLFVSNNYKLASNIINNLKNKGILLSTDGPYKNVIKIKPPLNFNKDNVNFVCYELDKYLSKL